WSKAACPPARRGRDSAASSSPRFPPCVGRSGRSRRYRRRSRGVLWATGAAAARPAPDPATAGGSEKGGSASCQIDPVRGQGVAVPQADRQRNGGVFGLPGKVGTGPPHVPG